LTGLPFRLNWTCCAFERNRDFMGWNMPWYSAHASLDALLVGRQIGLFHLVCCVRDGDRVFETYWTTRRGVEAMDYSYANTFEELRRNSFC
jgi:predicted dithiol-disulfide oxidoreductase (DUF899 family)